MRCHAFTFRSLVLSVAVVLTACSVSVEDNTNGNLATITPLEFLKKEYPVLTVAPTAEPAEIHLGENVTVTLTSPSGAKDARITWFSGMQTETTLAAQEKGNGEYSIQDAMLATVKEDTYVPTVMISTLTRQEQQDPAYQQGQGQYRTLTYSYDAKVSTKNYTVRATCVGDWSICSGGYTGTRAEELSSALAAGIESDLALTNFVVTGSGVDFAAEVTQVTRVDANNVDVFFTLTNNGTLDGTAKYAVWAHRTAAPIVNETASNYADQPLAAGQTVNMSWRVAYSSTSGNSYTAYVLIDWDGKAVESDETDNLGSLLWTVP